MIKTEKKSKNYEKIVVYKGKYVFTSSITKINPTRPKADIRELIFRIKFKRE
jgi:hypothetical protein